MRVRGINPKWDTDHPDQAADRLGEIEVDIPAEDIEEASETPVTKYSTGLVFPSRA